MDNTNFDTLTRRASRRTSLLTLGGAGLAAVFASPFTADAKNNQKGGKKNKKKKRQRPRVDRCPSQVEQCTNTLTVQCGSASCPDSIACCSFLGTCDASGFFACIVNASTN